MTVNPDLERLRRLVKAYTGDKQPLDTVFKRMTPDDRAEAQAILDRFAPFSGESADITATRQRALLDSVFMENALRDMLARPQYRVRNGKVATDPETSEPLRNEAAEKRIHAQMRKVLQRRSKLTGLPVESFEPDPDGTS